MLVRHLIAPKAVGKLSRIGKEIGFHIVRARAERVDTAVSRDDTQTGLVLGVVGRSLSLDGDQIAFEKIVGQGGPTGAGANCCVCF